jgi:two-component system NarL family sensor kinase
VSRDGPGQPPRDPAILNAVAEALHGSTDLQQALERTLGLVAGLLGLRTGWVWLLDGETDQFYVAAAQRLPPYLQEPVRMSGSWCYCTDLFRQGKLKPTNVDMLECSRLHPAIHARDPALTQGLRYHASIPLYFRERGLGIMNIAGPAWRPLAPAELRLLATIASQIGIAVERARLAEASTRLARAEERTRLAREIHDTLAQGLTAIGLDLEGALRHLEARPEQARERLERALTTARANLEEARRSVLDLRAEALAGRPLAEALAALGRAFTSETGVQVQVQAEPLELPIRVEAELYRIAQEALANVRQHAQATTVALVLRTTPRSVLLSIRDDGVGLPPAADGRAPRPAGHYGLIGMRERTRLLGGRLRVASRPGRGTTVTAQIPLGSEPEA